MRVAVTGATGNLGTALLERLGHEPAITSVTALSRRQPPSLPPKATWAPLDMSERRNLRPLFDGVDAVVHLAWIFQPTRDPVRTWNANVRGSMRVFDAVARAGVRTLVHASSIGAYAPGPSKRSVDESWPTHALPTAAYGREKSYLERVLDAYEHDHPRVRVVRMRPAFVFRASSASEQRRMFAGPFVPGMLVRPGLIPALPLPRGLRFQALHSDDAARAFQRALTSDVRGAFNLASEQIVDGEMLAGLLDARAITLPPAALRRVVAAAWRTRLTPASPGLVDLFLSLPTMEIGRARDHLGWAPRHTSLEAITEFLRGLRAASGAPTPPLDRRAGGWLRWRELATGVGARDDLPR